MGGQGRDVQVLDGGLLCGECRQLMEVSGKQAEAADFGGDVFADGPSQTEAIIGGRASAQLVNYDERVLRGRAGDTRHRSSDKVCVSLVFLVYKPVSVFTAEWQPSPASRT